MSNEVEVVKDYIRRAKLTEAEATEIRTWITIDYIPSLASQVIVAQEKAEMLRNLRKAGVIKAPATIAAPEGVAVPGDLYKPDPQTQFITGDRVLHEGRIMEAQTIPQTPTDFTPPTWADVTLMYQTPTGEESVDGL